jgi:hypothetical protein
MNFRERVQNSDFDLFDEYDDFFNVAVECEDIPDDVMCQLEIEADFFMKDI